MGLNGTTRRTWLRQAAAAAAGLAFRSRCEWASPAALPNPVGYANISWPPDQFDQALDTISSLGYTGVQLLGWVQESNRGAKTAALKQRLGQLHLEPAVLSCSKVLPRPDSPAMFMAEFHDYLEFLHSLGGKVLQILDGGEPRVSYSASQIKSLGSKLNEYGRIAKDSGLTVGYHPHFGRVGETREGLGRVLDATDPRYVGVIADVAHLMLGGSDPAEVIRTYRQRLVLLHLKDVRRDAYELARQNRDAVRKLPHRFCEIGTGVVDFSAVTASIRDADFRGWAIVELDAFEPPAGGPGESARTNREALRSLGFVINEKAGS